MLATLWEDVGGRGAGTLFGLILGSGVTWLIARWRRHREWGKVLLGDARDTVVIHYHIVETVDLPDADDNGPQRATVLRVRSLGQEQLDRVVPNGHLAAVLSRRASRVASHNTLIAMDGPEGSYLLETLTNFVGDRLGNAPFPHDTYVMTPCCEPRELALHQPISILLIAVADLELFADQSRCRGIQVEHGSDGARVLTLMEMARRFRAERSRIAELRSVGERTKYLETMYVLDLPLDRRAAPLPTKPVPWERYESILKLMKFSR